MGAHIMNEVCWGQSIVRTNFGDGELNWNICSTLSLSTTSDAFQEKNEDNEFTVLYSSTITKYISNYACSYRWSVFGGVAVSDNE